jgi:hypothetical protein
MFWHPALGIEGFRTKDQIRAHEDARFNCRDDRRQNHQGEGRPRLDQQNGPQKKSDEAFRKT